MYTFKVIIKYSLQTRVMVKYHQKAIGVGGFTRRRLVNNITTALSSPMMNTVSTDIPLKTIKTDKISTKRRRIEVDNSEDDDDTHSDDDDDDDDDDVDLKELEHDEGEEKMMVDKDPDDASDELYAEGCRNVWGNRGSRKFNPKKKGGKRSGKKKRGRPKGGRTKKTTKTKRGKKGKKKKGTVKRGKAKLKDILDSVL